jgi:hypothetical protein
VDPGSGAPVGDAAAMPREWLPASGERWVARVSEGGWVWVGPIRVGVGADRAGGEVVLRGHPAGEVVVYELAGAGRVGALLARVRVEWTVAEAEAMDVMDVDLPGPAVGAAGDAAAVPVRPLEFWLREHQRRWLAEHGLRVGWVEQDGDSLTAAAVATNGPELVAEAMRLVAAAAGMPVAPGGGVVTGRGLRVFLAALFEWVAAARHRDEGLFRALRLHEFPEGAESGSERPSLEGLAAALRRVGEHPVVLEDWLRSLLHSFFETARGLSGGGLDVGFGWLFEFAELAVVQDGEWRPAPYDAARQVRQVVVQVGQHYLPTAPAGQEPAGGDGRAARPGRLGPGPLRPGRG